MTGTILLRPHHGMCLAFYIGEGYSDAFTENMFRMRGLLEEGAFVCLTVGCDEICKKCPNKKDSSKDGGSKKSVSCCASEKKVAAYDRAVLRFCGLNEGSVLSFDEFTKAVQQNILSAGKRQKICAGCSWNYICESVKSRWQ